MRSTRLWRALTAVLAVSAATVTGVVAPVTVADAAPPPLPAPNSHGITLDSWAQVTASEGTNVPRYIDATVRTAAIFAPGPSGQAPSINPLDKQINVRILVPANYDANRVTPYPVLYLLHGGGADFEQWSKGDQGRIKELVAGSAFNGIVVMPEGGKSGWYTNWFGETDGHFSPQWETFHIGQLVPWVDDNFNTSGTRSGRAIAGVSMGGLGALAYGARFTSTFSAVGSFSGGTDLGDSAAKDIVNNSMWFYGATAWWNGNFDGNYRVNPWATGSSLDQRSYRMQTVFGPSSVVDGVVTHPTHSPVEMAANYNAYDGKLAMYSGQPGEPDNSRWNDKLHQRLTNAGVIHRYCRGQGTHDWEFWVPEMRDFLAYVYGTTPSTCTTNPGWSPVP